MKSAAGIRCIKSGYAILVQKLDIRSGYTPTGAGHSGSGCVSYYPIAETFSTEIHIHRKMSRFVFNTPRLASFKHYVCKTIEHLQTLANLNLAKALGIASRDLGPFLSLIKPGTGAVKRRACATPATKTVHIVGRKQVLWRWATT